MTVPVALRALSVVLLVIGVIMLSGAVSVVMLAEEEVGLVPVSRDGYGSVEIRVPAEVIVRKPPVVSSVSIEDPRSNWSTLIAGEEGQLVLPGGIYFFTIRGEPGSLVLEAKPYVDWARIALQAISGTLMLLGFLLLWIGSGRLAEYGGRGGSRG